MHKASEPHDKQPMSFWFTEQRKRFGRWLLLSGNTWAANIVVGGSIAIWRSLVGELGGKENDDSRLHCRRSALAADPNSIQLRCELVRDLLTLNRAEEAEQVANGTDVWRQLGGDFLAMGDVDRALYCRRRAVDADPSNLQLRRELASDSLAVDPGLLRTLTSAGDGPALRELALDRQKEGELEVAMRYLEWAYELNPMDHLVQEDFIRVLMNLGRTEEARKVSAEIDATKLSVSYVRRQYKDFTPEEKAVLVEINQFTLASPEAIVQLVRAVNYVLQNNIPGALVECGVFQGGNAVAIMRTLLGAGVTDRDLYLYDTFEGFPKPEEIDYEYFVGPALETWKKFKKPGDSSDQSSDWLRYPLELVRERLQGLGYPVARIKLVKGLVEDTIPATAPEQIALLRLDTDFYRSTKHELDHLYPRLQRGGVLIIDDYGALHGARVATDEFLSENRIAFLPVRIDEHVRIGIKLD